MHKNATIAALIIITAMPFYSSNVRAQGTFAPANGGTQLAMAVPACDSGNLRQFAQKNYQCSQFRIAQQLYKQVCQMPGATANDHYWLGESYMHAAMFAEAATAFQAALQLAPNSDSINVRLVHSLIASKQMPQAHQACLKAANAVAEPSARKQLAVLLKIASMPVPASLLREGNTANHVER